MNVIVSPVTSPFIRYVVPTLRAMMAFSTDLHAEQQYAITSRGCYA